MMKEVQENIKSYCIFLTNYAVNIVKY